MVQRIVRTEQSFIRGATTQAALEAEDYEDDPMLKKLVGVRDDRTGIDSILIDGQTVPVNDPFVDFYHGKEFMHPPNRPNDRAQVVGWRKSYDRFMPDYDRETRTWAGVAEQYERDRDFAKLRGQDITAAQQNVTTRGFALKKKQMENRRAALLSALAQLRRTQPKATAKSKAMSQQLTALSKDLSHLRRVEREYRAKMGW